MRFAHLADVHIGCWRHPKLSALPSECFDKAVSIALARKVDFVLIAGDLFHTALPGIDYLKSTVRTLKRLEGIPVYVIPGSHDFSPTGKSMIDVLEETGLVINVYKPSDGKLSVVTDPKTSARLVGILGKRNMLDKQEYLELDHDHLQNQMGDFNVFLFHTSLDELKERGEVLLPKGFDYYAGGHMHIREGVDLPGYSHIHYPGPIFPANFSELEELQSGSMIIYDDGAVERVPLSPKRVKILHVEGSSSQELFEKAKQGISDVDDAIVLLRMSGTLESGKVSDIDFKHLSAACEQKGAHVVLRNTSGVISAGAALNELQTASTKKIEETIIAEMVGKVSHTFSDEGLVMQQLLRSLSSEKQEGETVSRYEERIKDDAFSIIRP